MIIIDTHCDTLSALAKSECTQVTPDRLREGGVTLQVCALFAGSAGPSGIGGAAPPALAAASLAALSRFAEHGIRKVDSPFDICEGETSLMLSIEGGEIIEDSLDSLRRYRDAGVRIFSLTWNNENLIACPHCGRGNQGLKPFGWEVVRELDRLSIAVDVAHLGEGGFWDLIFHGNKPPMTSHSCCRALRFHTRNLTDDQIRALIDAGGWIGINFYTQFLTDAPTCDTGTVADHIAHIADLGGLGNVGFGSDFDGIDSAPADLQHPGDMPNLLTALAARGFSQSEIRGIAGENFLRYFKRLQGD